MSDATSFEKKRLRDEEGKMISIEWVITKVQKNTPVAKARLVARDINTGDKRGELFAGTPGLMPCEQ